MTIAKAPAERREFGRRTTCLHGWVVVEGRPRLACLVRNVSEGGALLEFAAPKSMPFRFKLVIECKGFEAVCETRHHQDQWMGVRFVHFERIVEPIARWSPDVDDAWQGKAGKGVAGQGLAARAPAPFGRAK